MNRNHLRKNGSVRELRHEMGVDPQRLDLLLTMLVSVRGHRFSFVIHLSLNWKGTVILITIAWYVKNIERPVKSHRAVWMRGFFFNINQLSFPKIRMYIVISIENRGSCSIVVKFCTWEYEGSEPLPSVVSNNHLQLTWISTFVNVSCMIICFRSSNVPPIDLLYCGC